MSNAASRDAPPGSYVATHAAGALAGALRFDLPEGLFDEALVVFLRHRSLQDLRRNGDRQIGRLGADLLQRARRLELDLALRVLDDVRGLDLRLLLQLVA